MLERGAEKNLHGSVRNRFDQLVNRARSLSVPGQCEHCSQPISRMSLTEDRGMGRVGFFCTDCVPGGGSRCVLVKPSFYTPDYFKSYDKSGAKFLVDAIKLRYFGRRVRLTQSKMEEFFNNPKHFANP
jgi:hypothetical protein